jgi:splicing factor 3A subunit 3
VPLGWDGKPIPYWLFKLHGLNHFYPCEICGGESYRGRRNFEKHFAESKHAYGMKCLGIPNTKHFHGVTKIEDAQELWMTLQKDLEEDQFDGATQEEYEDSHGNVLSRTTYEDLARQGLL